MSTLKTKRVKIFIISLIVLISGNTFSNELSSNKKTMPIKTMPINGVKDNKVIVQRLSLGLTKAEKKAFLTEMRQMLTSIQGIMVGIGENDPEKIIKAARYSGNRMARATPPSIKLKTPPSFQKIGGPTHMMFEELVIRAETDDMEDLILFTAEIMQQCLSCHELFKVD